MGEEQIPPTFRDLIFVGFRKPEYTNVPDELFDVLMPRLSGAELKVLLYIVRRTFGWKKGSDRISLSQFESGITRKTGQPLDGGTGLSRRAVLQALQILVEKNVLVKRRSTTKEKGHESTEYALNIIGNTPSAESSLGGHYPSAKSSLAPLDVENSLGLGNKVYKPLVQKVASQETVLQDTVNTVNVGASKETAESPSTDEQEAYNKLVVLDILKVLKDDQSRGFYLKVARRVPRDVIYQLISEIRADIINNPQSQVQNPASIFTKRIKELAAKRGIEL